MAEPARSLKFTVVGDGEVGKTCLLITFTTNQYPGEYVPTVFDNYACIVRVDDREHSLSLWDTAGQEDYERLRPLSYPNTACFIICYSIGNRASFENVRCKWLAELNHFGRRVPKLLVGTKLDLRVPHSTKFVTTAEGQRLAREIGAFNLVECSAKKKVDLDKVFEEAVRAVCDKRVPKKSFCHFL